MFSKVSLLHINQPSFVIIRFGTLVLLLIASLACGAGSTGSTSTLSQATSLSTMTPLEVQTRSLPSAADETPYSAHLNATGGVPPYFWQVPSGDLPTGFGLDSSAGTLFGTTNQSGTFSFQATVRDSRMASAYTSLSILVQDSLAPPLLSITTQALPSATVETPYSVSLAANGGVLPYSWEVLAGDPPSGFELDSGTGVLLGMPNLIGTSAFQVKVTDLDGTETNARLSIVVGPNESLTGPPNYLGSSTSTANPGPISPIFSSTAPTPTTCIGMCQNSTAYDTTLNPAGTDCITRITDSTTFRRGVSMGNLTFSGGDNDIMGSVNETYLGINTDQVYILHMNTSGNCIQVENTGTPGIHVAGPFGFSKVIDTRFYYLVNQTQLWQGDITSDTTFTPTKLVDIFAPGVCPGISPFATSSASIMGISRTDERFGWSVGPGGQGSADWAFVWDRNLGCASVNLATGSYWDFCSGSSCGPSTPSSGRLASTGCYGSQGSIMHGIHDSQMSGDGNWMIFAMQVTGSSNVGWSHGACAGSLLSNQQMIWHVGTHGSQWAYSNPSLGFGGSDSGSHNSAGVSNYLTPFYNGPNTRDFSNVTTFTQFAPPVITTDVHCSWPHPWNDDSYPWVCASDLVNTDQGGVYAPQYLSDVIYAWFPNTAYPPGLTPRQFTHTFSCGAGTDHAQCINDGDQSYQFGSQQSIGVATAKGNFFCWASTHLHNLGNDNLGHPRADGFCVHLQ